MTAFISIYLIFYQNVHMLYVGVSNRLCINISQCYSFYCIFDQIIAAIRYIFENIKDILQKYLKIKGLCLILYIYKKIYLNIYIKLCMGKISLA